MKISMLQLRARTYVATVLAALCCTSLWVTPEALAQEAQPPVVEASSSDAPPVKTLASGTTSKTKTATAAAAAAPGDPGDGGGSTTPPGIMPPVYTVVDGNGVDLLSGVLTLKEPINSIGGSGADGLATEDMHRAGSPMSPLNSYIQVWVTYNGAPDPNQANLLVTTLVLQGRSMLFRGQPATGITGRFYDAQGRFTHTASDITYIGVDGTIAKFAYVAWSPNNPTPIGRIVSLTYPTGEVLTFTRASGAGYANMKVESSLGYAFVGSNASDLYEPLAANLKNGGCTTDGCSGPTYADQRTLGRALEGTGVANSGGLVMTWRNATGDKPRIYTIANVENADRVVAYTDGVSTWTYSYSYVVDTFTNVPADGILTTTVTDPQGNVRVVKSRLSNSHVISDTFTGVDGLTRTTTVQYSADDQGLGKGWINQITYPEGNREYYEFDGYRNVTAKWRIPKGASTTIPVDQIPGTTVERAQYSCRLTPSGVGENCKWPDWSEDARGNRTDYAYDQLTGELISVTQPAGPSGKRPQTRFEYGTFTARYIVNGAWVTGAPARRVIKTSNCANGGAPTCLSTADETVTQYAYEDSSQPNNVRLVSKTVRAGDNSLSATTSYAYNDRGDVTAVDGPLPGSNDVVRSYYDASRWELGEVTPDPDGAGALLYRAAKKDFRADGQVGTAYVGVTADPNGFPANFQSRTRTVNDFDGQARVIRTTTFGTDGSAVAQSAFGFDNMGRPICSTVRMDPTSFGSPTALACDLTSASSGDRITYNEYDTIGRLTKITSGWKGAAPRMEKAVTYTLNSQEQTVADGKGNLTTYDYDNLDRLWKIRYPTKANGAVSSCGVDSDPSCDFERYEYDATGNRTLWRRRSGEQVAFTYDALNRAQNGLRGEAYGYDNLGRRTSATYAGGTTSTAFDPLGRLTTETTMGSTVSYLYDLAGRRTRITWPAGNFYVTYDYDNVGAMTAVRENGEGSGAFTLALFAYDNLGRRTATYRANSAQSYYGYDAASRLNSLTLDVAGTDNDQTWTFAYNAASQVQSRTASNSLYEWNRAQTSKAYSVNGLNQYVSVAGAAISYDGRGNLTNDGTKGYGYDLINNLTNVSTGAALSYEPAGRLFKVASGSTTTYFMYAGASIIGEYDANGLQRRYVPGPGDDETIVWYEGSNTADRRWLLANPQGSIVAITSSTGAAAWTNTYDEYGIPAAGNVGRFQYTGQAWLPEVGLYHYKARAYSPTLGRFLQTDPTGYDDGLNMYAYVGNDPLNNGDPTGMACRGRHCGSAAIIPRSAWARQSPDTSNMNRSSDVYRRVILHHTGASHATPQSVENLHRGGENATRGPLKALGFPVQTYNNGDVGYNYMIGKEGQIYAGRSLQFDGAHVSGANQGSIGIAFLGDFSSSGLNEDQMRSLGQLVGQLKEQYPDLTNMYTHGDFDSKKSDELAGARKQIDIIKKEHDLK